MPDERKHTRPTAGAPPANAFAAPFLARFAERDLPDKTLEADTRGPWVVREVDGGWAVFRFWEGAEASSPAAGRDRPAAVFAEREDALLLAAGLPLAAARARVHLAAEETPRGYALERDGEVIGHLAWFDPDAAEGFAAVDALAAGVGALAQLLEAAGSETVELAGRLLLREVEARAER